MPITFDPASKRIILDSAAVTAEEIYSAWVDWAATSDNAKYGEVVSQVGGTDLGGGLFIPNYLFLRMDWRVRPMESNHTLVITGNLFVDGGGVPVVQTLGAFNVSTQYTVPVQAQGIATSGSDPAAIADAVWAKAMLGGITFGDAMKIMAAVLYGKTIITATGPGTATVVFRDPLDTKNVVTAEMTGSTRTSLVLNP